MRVITSSAPFAKGKTFETLVYEGVFMVTEMGRVSEETKGTPQLVNFEIQQPMNKRAS